MTDRAYIVSRTLETKIAMAENNGNNALIVTIDMLKEILSLLKEQEKRINELEEKLRIDIPSKERNDNFDLYDTPIFGFHD